MQWIQDSRQSNADNLNNVRREANSNSETKEGIPES